MIDGVQLIDLTVHQDDRGYLYEVIHGSDSFMPQFGQVYVVGDPARGTIRAFHKHEKLHDWFCIVKGSAKFILHKQGDSMEVVLSERKPQLLVVPPGVYHGWMSLEDDTIMLSVASHEYDQENPDEERVAPEWFGDDWEVRGR